MYRESSLLSNNPDKVNLKNMELTSQREYPWWKVLAKPSIFTKVERMGHEEVGVVLMVKISAEYRGNSML